MDFFRDDAQGGGRGGTAVVRIGKLVTFMLVTLTAVAMTSPDGGPSASVVANATYAIQRAIGPM